MALSTLASLIAGRWVWSRPQGALPGPIAGGPASQAPLPARPASSTPLGTPLVPAPAAAASAVLPPTTKLRFTFSRQFDDPRTQWLIALYRHLLSTLNIGFEFIDVPPGRGTLLVEAGDADGELGRTFGYGDLYPWLVRVPEPNNRVEFVAYATRTTLREFPGWAAAKQQGLRCEYRRGIYEMQALLGKELTRRQVSAVGTIEQGVRRLQLARTDLFFDVHEAIEDYFEFGFASSEVLANARPQMVGVVKATTGHAYLHQRHQALVPAISKALVELKRQGVVARYREEAAQAFLLAHNLLPPTSAGAPRHRGKVKGR